MLDTGEWWYDVTSGKGQFAPDVNQDMISPAFWTVTGSEFKITRSDDVNHTALLHTASNCLNSATFRSKITSYGNFRNGVMWNSNQCKGSCDVIYGGNFSTTEGFQMHSCDSNLQAHNKIGFWCRWYGDGAVMMIGGGGDRCNRADRGIGITEENYASFKFASTVYKGVGEYDFGGDAAYIINAQYALNLWVK